VSDSGINWAVCKSAPRSRQMTIQAPTTQFFTGPSCRPTNSIKDSEVKSPNSWTVAVCVIRSRVEPRCQSHRLFHASVVCSQSKGPFVTDTAHVVCDRVYVMAGCPSVCLCTTGGFATVGPAGRRYQWISAHSSNCEQCHVISWRRKLNTDLLGNIFSNLLCHNICFLLLIWQLCLQWKSPDET